MEEEQKTEDIKEENKEEESKEEKESKKESKPSKKTKVKKKKNKKKGAWKKELTTVTPLSKLLTMAFFIILPFVAFMLGTQMADIVDVYGFLDANKKVQTQGSTTVETVIKKEIVKTLTYRDSNLEFEFEYPVEWGAIGYRFKPVLFSEEDVENAEYADIDFDEVQTQRWYIDFIELPCLEDENCFASMQVYKFDKKIPLELICEEDECWTEDFREDKDFVEKEYDFENNNLYWYCEAGVYTNDDMLGLMCRTYTKESFIQISTGYVVDDIEEVMEVCEENLSDFECTKDFVKDKEEYLSFNKGLSTILESFQEIK